MKAGRHKSPKGEEGIALIASMLVMMVCLILVAAGTQLAIHSTQRSGLSRNRSASLHAAEAGIEAALSSLSAVANLGTCAGMPVSEVQLPDQNLPSESYKIMPVSCPASGNVVIASVGYVPNATHPVASTTIVAHIDVSRGLAAPISGGGSGGYVFPDAIFSGGLLTASAAGPLSAYGTGGTVPSVVANGPMDITGSQLDGLVHGWNTVKLNVAAVGGEVIGNGVTLIGATVQGGTGGVLSADNPANAANNPANLTLTNSTVNGTAKYNGTLVSSGSTVTAPGGAAKNVPAVSVLTPRLLPTFTDNQPDYQALAGTGSTPPTPTCPGTGTGAYYDVPVNVACTYNPPTINGTVVVVVHGGALTVNVPQTTTGGQLYVIAQGLTPLTPASIILTGTNSSLPVFAFADGALTVSGGITGQLVGGSITTTGATTVTFAPPATTAPDFAFNSSQTAPSGLGYAANVAFEYQCPGVVAC